MKTFFFALIAFSGFAKANPVQTSVRYCEDFVRVYLADKQINSLWASSTTSTGIALMMTATDTGYLPIKLVSSTVGAGIFAAGAVKAAINIYDISALANFPRLAYELGTDQESLVTEAFKNSCIEKQRGDCKKLISRLKEQAKSGTMCEAWSSFGDWR